MIKNTVEQLPLYVKFYLQHYNLYPSSNVITSEIKSKNLRWEGQEIRMQNVVQESIMKDTTWKNNCKWQDTIRRI